MLPRRYYALFVVLLALWVVKISAAAEPRVTDDRYKLELIASEPEIVTPVGVAFDRQGRLLVIESHTHLRAEGYKGPGGDRIRMLSDSNGDGTLDRWSTFAEGFRHAMNLLVRDDGAVYLVARHNVVLLQDTDHDGVSDKQDELLRLETKDDYPHNALSGIARDVDGSLIVGLGENHGDAYRLTGADGTVIKDGGGQDGFFRMTADGKGVTRFARGVWNPFSVCVLADGRIFAVDNDPDASPPCRLLHVVPGGDYGYLYQYGRAGTHPLQAWNGELPGTLPMVCGVGEGPTAIVPHAGGLWVTSWGDHRIERYGLVPRGASYGAKRDVIVQGDANFRPTGMAVAPDGSLYFADWVLRDYPVHGRGQIWRLVLPRDDISKSFPPRTPEDVAAEKNPSSLTKDPFALARQAWEISHSDHIEELASAISKETGVPILYRRHWEILAALRWHSTPQAEAVLRACLTDKNDATRLFAVRWIADERITALRNDVAKLLDGPQTSPQLYLALLGAVDWLDHEPSQRGAEITDALLVRELKNEKRSSGVHALALRMLSPDDKFLTSDRLREYLQADDKQLRSEAIRSLALRSNAKRGGLLAEVAVDESQSDSVRAEAIAGLAPFTEDSSLIKVLRTFADSKNSMLRREADRALRLSTGSPPSETKPASSDGAAWRKVLEQPGDAESGRRLFFSAVGPRCGVCHKYDGRGGNVGPDLTAISRSATRERIITSILQPGQEIAPDYQPWMLVTSDGKTYTGLRLPKPGDNGKEDYIDSTGHVFTLSSASIEERRAATTSIMPDNLQSTLSIDDLRDLVTFLSPPPSLK